ncbi:MAG TPA: FHA domain-containing protein [Planctomycetota bacterium]|nr:FHA domain-containing protein [Planctomycetota bacterium]
MAKIKITDELGRERVHELIDDVTTIGRASANTVQVTDEKASRNHFRIEKDGDKYKLVDLGSTNGTRLNGQKVQGTVYLRNGDTIQLGKTIFVYDGPGEAAVTGGDTVALDPVVLDAPKPAKPADGPRYVLRVLEGAKAGTTFELGHKPLTLGRHASNTIQIIDDAASNYHAEVNREPIGYVLTDLGSTNGTRIKAKNKTEFEKVVKSPLAAGMQIKVGKTLLEYVNVGAPEDELFGTVALDPARADAAPAETRRGAPVALLAVLALIVAGGAGVAVWKLRGDKTAVITPPAVEKVDTSNRIANGDFSQGTDDLGNPKEFRIERGTPDVKVAVVADADRNAKEAAIQVADPNTKVEPRTRLGLQVSKAGRSPSALTAVETSTSFPVSAGKTYELGGWMQNNGDGLFGLRVTWIAGDRTYSENPVVLKDTQEWKEKLALVTPPPWAQRAKAGIFVQGKEGKACFDDLRFIEKGASAGTAAPAVKFQGISLSFEGTKGVFSVSSQGDRVVEDAMLLLVTPDGGATSDLASAVEPQTTQDASKAAVDGKIYDFAMQDLTNYRLQAQPGATGVELRVAVDNAGDTASRPQLRFYVTGAVGQGDVEIARAGNVTERMLSADSEKSFTDVQEVLFNAGKAPQFDLAFTKPAHVEIRREGTRRKVVIQFKGDVQVALAPESILRKQQMQAAVGDLQRAMDARKWGEAEGKIKALKENYGALFPQAQSEAQKAADVLEAARKAAQVEINSGFDALKAGQSAAAVNALKDTINRHAQAWAGSSHEAEFTDKLKLADEVAKAGDSTKAEEQAEKMYGEAERYFNIKAYPVAISILRKRILEDPTGQKTKVVDKAKELLAKAEAADQRAQELNAISARLREKSKNYLLTNDYKGAILAIEKDTEYQANRADLQAINDLLAEWKKKAQ